MKTLIVLIFSSTLASCANILAILPLPFYSHLKFHEKVLETLLDRGHTVTALVEGSLRRHDNLTQHILNCGQELLEFDSFKMKDVFAGSVLVHWALLSMKQQLAQVEVEIVKEMIEKGNENHFDLIISESYGFNILNQFAELYDCPIVICTPMDPSVHIHSAMGNEVNPNMLGDPSVFPYDAKTVAFFHKMRATLCVALYLIFKAILDVGSVQIIKSHFWQAKESPSQIEDRIALVMTNTHQALGFVRPETNRIHVGFLDIEQPKALPEGALKEFVDRSEKGIILVNFGSTIKTTSLPEDMISVFMKVFASLQYRVVWKFHDAQLAHKTKNIFLSDWLPQTDLLGHPKMKLFINHGGLNSIQESIDQGIPMLVMPGFGDQLFNAHASEQGEYGVVLHHKDVTEKTLLEAINKALEPKYKRNVEQLREIVYSYPMTSRETVVWWIEHVIKNKGLDYMRYPGRKVSFFRKYYLDWMAFVMATIFILKKLWRIIVS